MDPYRLFVYNAAGRLIGPATVMRLSMALSHPFSQIGY
jgi:hypothetical protein